MVTKILVPVDGSAHADRAVDFAADLAKKYDADLVLIHVLAHSGSGRVPDELKEYTRLEHVEVTERDVLTGLGNEIVTAARQRARAAGREAGGGAVEFGDPAETVVAYARDNGVDLIVMGRRGLGRLRGLLMGSVSGKVAQLADCTCVTVK